MNIPDFIWILYSIAIFISDFVLYLAVNVLFLPFLILFLALGILYSAYGWIVYDLTDGTSRYISEKNATLDCMTYSGDYGLTIVEKINKKYPDAILNSEGNLSISSLYPLLTRLEIEGTITSRYEKLPDSESKENARKLFAKVRDGGGLQNTISNNSPDTFPGPTPAFAYSEFKI